MSYALDVKVCHVAFWQRSRRAASLQIGRPQNVRTDSPIAGYVTRAIEGRVRTTNWHRVCPSSGNALPVLDHGNTVDLPNSFFFGDEQIVTMHARQMIDMAVWVATHCQGLLVPKSQIPLPAIERYWSSSKCRLDRWGWALKQVRQSPVSEINRDGTFRSLLVEILTAEVLTRTWSAVLCAHDRQRGTAEVEPIARSVFIGHIEARHRALSILLEHAGNDLRWAVEADRIRRRTERWTDLLIALMSELPGAIEFAVESERVVEFGLGCGQRSTATATVVGASIRAASRRLDHEQSPNADSNALVSASVLGCFPTAAFDGVGVPYSPAYWAVLSGARDERATADRPAPRPLETADRFATRRVFWPGSNQSD